MAEILMFETGNNIRKYVHLNFGGDTGIEVPDGFDELTINQKVTVTLKGTVQAIHQDKTRSGLSILVTGVTLDTGRKGLEKALEQAKEARKMK